VSKNVEFCIAAHKVTRIVGTDYPNTTTATAIDTVPVAAAAATTTITTAVLQFFFNQSISPQLLHFRQDPPKVTKTEIMGLLERDFQQAG